MKEKEVQKILTSCQQPRRTDEALMEYVLPDQERTDEAMQRTDRDIQRTDEAVKERIDEAMKEKSDEALLEKTDEALPEKTDETLPEGPQEDQSYIALCFISKSFNHFKIN